MWDWLGENYRQVGALSSIAFGLASLCVGVIAYRLNYRNNFGWPPVMVVRSTSVSSRGQESFVEAEFSIWNRHKYAIVIVELIADYRFCELVCEDRTAHRDREWIVRNGRRVNWHGREALDPNKEFQIDLEARSDNGSMEEPTITVRYIDPLSGKYRHAVSKGESFRRNITRVGLWQALRAWWRKEPAWYFEWR